MIETFFALDPRTTLPRGKPFKENAPAEVGIAVRAAAVAFAVIRNWQPIRFATLLEVAAREVEELGDALISIADEETALGRARLEPERMRTCTQMRLFADLLRAGWYREPTIDRANPAASAFRPDLRRMLVPLGPVAVFGASNFPLAWGQPRSAASCAGSPGRACPRRYKMGIRRARGN